MVLRRSRVVLVVLLAGVSLVLLPIAPAASHPVLGYRVVSALCLSWEPLSSLDWRRLGRIR